MYELIQFDKECFQKAIEVARETYKKGNFPVGAVLTIDDEIIDIAGNTKNEQQTYVNHAENTLIINNGKKLAQAYKKGRKISLYSTLEPCIQCLGASVINHIDRILYIEKDPNGGACDIKHDNIGIWYKEVWPEIVYVPFTDELKKLMIKFFHEEIERGNTKWPKKMLGLFGEKY